MEHSKFLIFTSLLLISAPCSALNLAEINHPIEQGLYDSRSCNDLYMQALNLEKESHLYKTDRNNTTQVASLISTVFAPAIYYLGYSAYQDYKQEKLTQTAFVEIEDIRLRLAEKRCFVK